MISPRLITAVIPVGPDESSWPELVATLRRHLPHSPVILCGPAPRDAALAEQRKTFTSIPAVQWIEESGGRARQLNLACRAAETPWIWCLHADSRLEASAIATVLESASETSPSLYYLDLAFASDGPALMRLNAWGANARSRILRMPFGDQAFLFPKYVWEKCGMFSERESYGEDHVFVWRARSLHVPVVRLPARVVTSARKYTKNGWLRTTWTHFILTWRQAAREWLRSLTAHREGGSRG